MPSRSWPVRFRSRAPTGRCRFDSGRLVSRPSDAWAWSIGRAPGLCSHHLVVRIPDFQSGGRSSILRGSAAAGASSNGRTLVFGASYAGSIPAAPTTRWRVISPLLNRSTGSGATRERRGRSTFGRRPMAGQRSLMPPIGVRVPAPELMHRDATGSRLPCLGSETGSSPVRCAMSLSSSG